MIFVHKSKSEPIRKLIRLITWNMARRQRAWQHLTGLNADVALLQEAGTPPEGIAGRFETDDAPWRTVLVGKTPPWRAAVVKLSDRVAIEWINAKPVHESGSEDLVISRPGTLAAAKVTGTSGETLIVVSMYAIWESPHSSTRSSWIYADGSVHRLISDLSAFIGQQSGHRIIAAGDLNVLRGYGEEGSVYWAQRYATVFDRMKALDLLCVGPRFPHGRRAEPWPVELPKDSDNVPTFHSNRQTPATATRQLDYVFASTSLAERVQVTALNDPEEWGPSDHCKIEIQID